MCHIITHKYINNILSIYQSTILRKEGSFWKPKENHKEEIENKKEQWGDEWEQSKIHYIFENVIMEPIISRAVFNNLIAKILWFIKYSVHVLLKFLICFTIGTKSWQLNGQSCWEERDIRLFLLLFMSINFHYMTLIKENMIWVRFQKHWSLLVSGENV